MKKYIASFILLSFCLAGCQNELMLDDPPASKGNGVTFHIKSPVADSGERTRSERSARVSSLRYLLADSDGKILTHCTGYISEALDRLDINGLSAGEYTIAFLGSCSESDLARIELPGKLDDTWLQNTMESLPVGGSYFIKKIDFSLKPELTARDYEVVLDRALSMIKIEFPGIPAAVEAMISSVTVSLDEGNHVYSAINADCSFAGEATIRDYEVCDSSFSLSLATLPSVSPLSGIVKVKAATLSGDSISTSYRFSNLCVQAGKINTIAVDLRHPDIKTGFIHIRPKDYFDYDADLMLMEDEPMDVMHDSTQRSFRLQEPLVLKNWNNQLRLQLYSATPSGNVDIFANFPSLGIDSVRLVHFDKVEPLLDMLVPLTFTKREAQYLDIHGKRVSLPKMDIPADIEWIVKTDDPYLTRMCKIGLKNWKIGFHNWETIWPSKAVAPDPQCMRHAFVQIVNLALTFDSEEFAEELSAHDGEYIDSGLHFSAEEIMNRIRNSHGGSYGLGANNVSSGHNGWGGGWHSGYTSVIITQTYFARMYPVHNPETPCNRERECLYHEHAHCLGFTHDGNMTYCGIWTNTVGTAYLRAHAAGKIFFYSPDFIESIPYRRSEAPEWVSDGYYNSLQMR